MSCIYQYSTLKRTWPPILFIKNKNIAITIDLTSAGTTSTITVNKTANQVSAAIEIIKMMISLFQLISHYNLNLQPNKKIDDNLYRKSSILEEIRNNMEALPIKHQLPEERQEPKTEIRI